ncbi:MAG: hypothetical protein WDA22_03710 [Bacteroidota bacterium]
MPPKNGVDVTVQASFDGYSKTKKFHVNPVENLLVFLSGNPPFHHNNKSFIFVLSFDRNWEEIILPNDELFLLTIDSTQFGTFYNGNDSLEEIHAKYSQLMNGDVVSYIFNGDPIRKYTPLKLTAQLERDPTVRGKTSMAISQQIHHLVARVDPNPVIPGGRSNIIVQPQDADSNDVELYLYQDAEMRIWYDDTTYGKFVADYPLPAVVSEERDTRNVQVIGKIGESNIPEYALAQIEKKYSKLFGRKIEPAKTPKKSATVEQPNIPIEGQFYLETLFPRPNEIIAAFEAKDTAIHLPRDVNFTVVQYYTYFIEGVKYYQPGYLGTGKVVIENNEEKLCPVVSIFPERIKAGETAEVIVKGKKQDGTIVDYPSGTQFTFTITSGAEFGMIVGNTSPAQYVAKEEINTDSAVVTVQVAIAGGSTMAIKKRGVQANSAGAFECSVPVVSVAIVSEPKLEVIYPTDGLFDEKKISAVPQMPVASLKARLQHYNGGTVNYVWHFQAEWIGHDGRNINQWFTGNTIAQNADQSIWDVNWNGVIRGGDRSTLYVTATADGKVYDKAVFDGLKITGLNPSKDEVKSGLSLEEQVIVYKESKPKWHHFKSDGFPIFGIPHGYGLMQIDNPRATDEQVWNWKANRTAGKTLFEEKKRMAAAHLRNVKKKYPSANFTQQEQLTEEFQLYNGQYYWVWTVTDEESKSGQWTKNSKLNRDYGGDAIQIYNAVTGGHPPAGW